MRPVLSKNPRGAPPLSGKGLFRAPRLCFDCLKRAASSRFSKKVVTQKLDGRPCFEIREFRNARTGDGLGRVRPMRPDRRRARRTARSVVLWEMSAKGYTKTRFRRSKNRRTTCG